jgi:hypothetical protein
MANERIPEDPYRPTFAGDDELRRPAPLDNELQPDPELAEGPASSGRIAIFAVGVAIVLGAVFYGLNSSSINQAGTSSTAQNAPATPAQNPAPPQSTAQTSPTAAPPGMRDVTPHANTNPNTNPGVTTGAAPARPQGAPAPAPTGQSADRPGPATANPSNNNNN